MYVKIEGNFTGDVFEGNIEFKKASDDLLRQFATKAMPSIVNTVFEKFAKEIIKGDYSEDQKIHLLSLSALVLEQNVINRLSTTVDDSIGQIKEISDEEDEESEEEYEEEDDK